MIARGRINIKAGWRPSCGINVMETFNWHDSRSDNGPGTRSLTLVLCWHFPLENQVFLFMLLGDNTCCCNTVV
jgi:hypothetical protein